MFDELQIEAVNILYTNPLSVHTHTLSPSRDSVRLGMMAMNQTHALKDNSSASLVHKYMPCVRAHLGRLVFRSQFLYVHVIRWKRR